jgi:microcystin-dependent protein
MNIKDIILIILIIISIYLFYKTNRIENFNDTTDINMLIKNQYIKDTDSMRNLIDFLNFTEINNNTINIPNVTLDSNNIFVNGNLNTNGNIKFINKNMNIMEIFPKYMVIPWGNNIFPKGWAYCDGKRYIIGINGFAVESLDETNSILTPDLRNRFIIGAGSSANKLTPRELKEVGGEETHKLTLEEMPAHTHSYGIAVGYNESKNNDGTPRYDSIKLPVTPDRRYPVEENIYFYGANSIGSTSVSDEYINVSLIGNNKPHNNMPPFYSLYYIMKL